MASQRLYLTRLECVECGANQPVDADRHLCACGGILFARYDLPALAREVPRSALATRPWNDGLWRYAELLPVLPAHRVTLGEGATPLLALDRLSAEIGAEVWLKDEGLNPTGSFKARGAA